MTMMTTKRIKVEGCCDGAGDRSELLCHLYHVVGDRETVKDSFMERVIDFIDSIKLLELSIEVVDNDITDK